MFTITTFLFNILLMGKQPFIGGYYNIAPSSFSITASPYEVDAITITY